MREVFFYQFYWEYTILNHTQHCLITLGPIADIYIKPRDCYKKNVYLLIFIMLKPQEKCHIEKQVYTLKSVKVQLGILKRRKQQLFPL